jgi:competence protein ComEC
MIGLEELSATKSINGIGFRVLYPPTDFLQRKTKDPWRTLNNNSLVLKVSFDRVSFLLTGDIETEAEKEITGLRGKALKSTVLLVPHHGSKTSSSPGFLESVDPAIAVISAGWKNRFGFPLQSVLKRYEGRGCKVFRTDLDGAITIATDGTDVKVRPFLCD